MLYFFKCIKRFFTIISILSKYEIDKVLGFKFSILTIVRFFSPFLLFKKQKINNEDKVYFCLEELGPIFIKIGQILSSRIDIIPAKYINKIIKLRDNVKPISTEAAIECIDKAYNGTSKKIFSYIEPNALGSASVAQVHKAKLTNGETIVIKFIKPGVEEKIKIDIVLAFFFEKIFSLFSRKIKKIKLKEFISEYSDTITKEIDLQNEAASASQLSRDLKKIKNTYIPTIYWKYSNSKVLVMEYIDAVPLTNYQELSKANTDLKKIAKTCIEILFTSALQHGFFHADMHPGNIFVDISNPNSPKIILIDFGITSSLSKLDRKYLIENFSAFFERDYMKVAKLHVESGWLSGDIQQIKFANELRCVYEPIFQQEVGDISFAKNLEALIRTAEKFSIKLQPQFLLLQKTALNIEGICRQFAPQISLNQLSKPMLKKWLKKRIDYKKVYSDLSLKLPYLIETLPEIPYKLEKTYNSIEKIVNALEKNDNKSVSQHLKKYVGVALITFGLTVFAASYLKLWLNGNELLLPFLSMVTGLILIKK